MTNLVTGATGFLGTKLVCALLDRGDAVYYLARTRSAKLPSQASFHPWDITRKPELNALSRIDRVFHLVGEPIAQRWTPEVKRRIYDSRILGTRNLVAAIGDLQHKPGVLVSASAVGYYGDGGDEELTESTPPGTDFLSSLCQDWEQAALRARELGVRVVTPRIATVLGREGGALPVMRTPFRFGLGGRFGSGKQWMSWIHIDDLLRLFVFAAETPSVNGPLNAASPKPVRNVDFTKTLAHALHRPAPFMVPKFAMRLAVGELAYVLFSSQRVIPKFASESGFTYTHPELGNALADLL